MLQNKFFAESIFNFWKNILVLRMRNKEVLGCKRANDIFFAGLEDLEPRPVLNINVKGLKIALKV